MTWMYGQQHAIPAFHDHGWKRAEMAAWDDSWAKLSVPARNVFLDVPRPGRNHGNPAAMPMGGGPLRDELVAGGLVEDVDAKKVRLTTSAIGFAKRLHALRESQLLAPSGGNFRGYVQACFHSYYLGSAFDKVLTKNAGPMPGMYTEEYFTYYVNRRFWPDWVVKFLDDPIALRIVQGLDEESGPVSLASMARRLPKREPDKVRAALDGLVNYLAVVEGLDPKTKELMVGFRPEVKARRVQALSPKTLPKLTERPAPPELAPEGGLLVLDLRTILLELAGQPGRVRQDGGLYAKELERFVVAMLEEPQWVSETTDELEGRVERLEQIVRLVGYIGFVDPIDRDEKEMLLRPSKTGQEWLASGFGSQYERLYRYYRNDRSGYMSSSNDEVYLGTGLVARNKDKKEKQTWVLGKEDREAFREAVYGAFARLPEGKYVRMNDFVEATALGPDNPFLLGTGDPTKVDLRANNRPIPPVLDLFEEHGRQLLEDVIHHFVRLGCLRLGREADGHLVLCRMPWLDVYFDKAKPPPDVETAATKTIVQPDFSVIVIGIAPAAAADLALFCNRTQGQPGQGAITFRITKESVWRARSTGLTEADLLDRLDKHASTPVPANVKTQIRSWSAQVSNVNTSAGRLFRCADAATADRVKSLLGKESERVGPAMVFWNYSGRIRPALRKKLQDNGVMLRED